MLRKILRSKLHSATVTHADLAYEGSITLPTNLIEAAGLREYEAVDIWNVTNGNRLETYIIKNPDPTDQKSICINGAAAHLMHPGDKVIIACFQYLQESSLANYEPTVLILDENNQIKEERLEIPGPAIN